MAPRSLCGEVIFILDKEEVTLHCLYCGKEFIKLGYFSNHLKIHHLKEMQGNMRKEDDDEEEVAKGEEAVAEEAEFNDKLENIDAKHVVVDEGCCSESVFIEMPAENNVHAPDEWEAIEEDQNSEKLSPDEEDESSSSQSASLAGRHTQGNAVVVALIKQLEMNPSVWDNGHEDFHKRMVRTASYDRITKELNAQFPRKYVTRQYVRCKTAQLRKVFLATEAGRPPPGSAELYARLGFLRGRCVATEKTIVYTNAAGLYECSECAMEFKERSNLSQHMRRHRKEYSYKCDYCDKPFYTAFEKGVHMQRHLAERLFMCEICAKNFHSNAELRRHRKLHLGQRDYNCTLCPKKFFRKETLRDHMNVHINYRPEVCDICTKSFFTKNCLQQHKKLHSNTKEYICNICDKRFAQSSGLSLHLRRHSSCIR